MVPLITAGIQVAGCVNGVQIATSGRLWGSNVNAPMKRGQPGEFGRKTDPTGFESDL